MLVKLTNVCWNEFTVYTPGMDVSWWAWEVPKWEGGQGSRVGKGQAGQLGLFVREGDSSGSRSKIVEVRVSVRLMSGITSNAVMYDRLANLRYELVFFLHRIIHYQLRIHPMKHFSVLFTCQFINKTPRGEIRSVVGREGSLTKKRQRGAKLRGRRDWINTFFTSSSPAANYVRFRFLIDVGG